MTNSTTMILIVITIVIGVSSATGTSINSLACGAISLSQFDSMFASSNTSQGVIQDNFVALVAACEYAQIERLDRNQASFLIGSIAFNTANLTSHVSMQERLAGNSTFGRYAPRGAMMLAGQVQYAAFQAWAATLLVTFDVVANPEQVGSSLIVSYLSALYVVSAVQSSGKTCLQMTSAGNVGTCIASINSWECTNEQEQSGRLRLIQLASSVMGQRYTDAEIESFRCSPLAPSPCNGGNATTATTSTTATVVPVSDVPCSCTAAKSDLSAAAAAIAAAISNGTLASTKVACIPTNGTTVDTITTAPTTLAPVTLAPAANATNATNATSTVGPLVVNGTNASSIAPATSGPVTLAPVVVTPLPTPSCNCTNQDLIDVLTSGSSRSSWSSAIGVVVALLAAVILV